MPLGFIEATFLGTVLEGVFYGNLYYKYDDHASVPEHLSPLGLYCVVFVLYIRVHLSKKSDHRNFLIYPISTLFLLCTTFFALDFTQQYLSVVSKTSPT